VSITFIAAGPSSTMNSLGKMKILSGAVKAASAIASKMDRTGA
jgi:hypothetical protein